MRSYKKWSKEEREQSLRLCRKAISFEWLRPRIACERCGQQLGILHMHNEDYDVTLGILPKALELGLITTEEKIAINECMEVLCWRCHMIHHSAHRAPEQCARYWRELEEGTVYPPVYMHDFSILYRDHGIR